MYKCLTLITDNSNKDPSETYRVLKPFFLMVKQTPHKNYKLRVTQALSRLARHVTVVDEIKSLWQPVLDLLLDADYETRFALSESLRDLVKGLNYIFFYYIKKRIFPYSNKFELTLIVLKGIVFKVFMVV